MQVGTTKDQGLYNKPSATVHPGALAAGILPQYNTKHVNEGSIERQVEGTERRGRRCTQLSVDRTETR